MKLYLDNSFLNRPFDNLDIGFNKLETEILFLIIRLVKRARLILISSSVVEYENSLNPFPERKAFVREIAKLATIYQNLNDDIKIRSTKISKEMGIKPIDSLHLATAEFAKVDLFITCDYNLSDKYKGNLKVIQPTDFLNFYEKCGN